MSRRRRTPRVLLLVETSRGYGRGILQGITQYAQEHGPWATCFEERGLEEPPPGWLKDWQGEGIISRTATKEVAKAIQATGLPVVELLGDFRAASAHVHPDNALVGRIAVEHLLDQGLRNFAYFAFGESYWIRLRREGFQQTLDERGFSSHVYKSVHSQDKAIPRWSEDEWPHLLDWLRALPRPIGILAVNDSQALRLMSACRMLGISMPEEAAVLGVNNDLVVCDAATPPLSSVDVNCGRIGYEAAALLDRMMAGASAAKADPGAARDCGRKAIDRRAGGR